MSNPSVDHFRAINVVWQYLVYSLDLGIEMSTISTKNGLQKFDYTTSNPNPNSTPNIINRISNNVFHHHLGHPIISATQNRTKIHEIDNDISQQLLRNNI